ncbi:MAG: hypothetical protein ACK55I_28030, partial [bacterium]
VFLRGLPPLISPALRHLRTRPVRLVPSSAKGERRGVPGRTRLVTDIQMVSMWKLVNGLEHVRRWVVDRLWSVASHAHTAGAIDFGRGFPWRSKGTLPVGPR